MRRKKRLSERDAINLLTNEEHIELGCRAFDEKVSRFGMKITYTRNIHINPTNLCVYSCAFCDFAAKPSAPHAYSMSEDDILAKILDPSILEVHIVGGLWPTWGFKRSLNLVSAIRNLRPDIWIKAFTAVEIAYFSRMEGCSVESIICQLRDAGVNCFPGGGAEILSDRIHSLLFKEKIGPREWLQIHECAHRLGIETNCTMLFGHIEEPAEVVSHLEALRALQDKTGGFSCFIPLAYQPGRSRLVPEIVSSMYCLKIISLSRLFLDNIPHIRSYWPSLEIETACAGLSFGADDLDGTIMNERIMNLAGSNAPKGIDEENVRVIIRHSGQDPVLRTGSFETFAGTTPSSRTLHD